MAGTITISHLGNLQGQRTFNGAAANGIGFSVGTLALSTYTGGGLASFVGFGFNNVDAVIIPNASGYAFEWRNASGVLVVLENPSDTGTGVAGPFLEVASDTELASFSALPFVAFGH